MADVCAVIGCNIPRYKGLPYCKTHSTPDSIRMADGDQDKLNSSLSLLKDIYFGFSQSKAETMLGELTRHNFSQLDVENLRYYCIERLPRFVEEQIERYLDDLAIQKREEEKLSSIVPKITTEAKE